MLSVVAIRPLDIVVIALYLAGMAAIAVYFARRNTTTEEYFVGNRSFSGPTLGLSLMATSVSSVAFLAFPAAAYADDFRDLVINLTLPIGVLLAVVVFIPLFRRGKTTSAYEYLGARYGVIIRLYGTFSFMIMRLCWLGIVLCLISNLIVVLTGWEMVPVIIATGLFVALYTVIGGIDAVIWTDVIQSIVLLLGGIVTVVYLTTQIPGGLAQVFEVGLAEGKFGLGTMEWSLSNRSFWAALTLGIFAWTAYQADQNIVQRYLAARSTREARKATIIYGAIVLPTWAYFFFVGTCLFVYFQALPDTEVTRLSEAQLFEQVYPHFILTRLPPGIAGMVVAGVISAAMSSVDSTLNAVSTVTVIDIVKPHLARGRSDRFYLNTARTVAVAAAAIMITVAVVLSQIPTKTINELDWAIGSIFAGCLMGLFVLGFFTTRVDNVAALIGLAVAVLLNLYLVLGVIDWLPQALTCPVHKFWIGPIVNVAFIVVAYAASWRRQRKKEPLTGLTVWTPGD